MSLRDRRSTVGPRGVTTYSDRLILSTETWRHLPGTGWQALLKGKGFMILTIERKLWCDCRRPHHVRGIAGCRDAGEQYAGWLVPIGRVYLRPAYVSLQHRTRDARRRMIRGIAA